MMNKSLKPARVRTLRSGTCLNVVSVLLACLAVLAAASCASPPLRFAFDAPPRTGGTGSAVTGGENPAPAFPVYPDIRMVHVSDTHAFIPSLGITGKAFEDYLNRDRKLLAQSTMILDSVVFDIAARSPDVVIVSGDLTKDGERVNHEYFASWCAAVEKTGAKVYVVPGNHDINNPHARSFAGDKTEAAEQSDPAAFASMYQDYGYGEAVQRDPASLSYLVQPVPGLWVLAIDSADYEDNHARNTPVTAGRIRPATLVWMEDILIRARQQGIAVMAVMHHGVVEHWPGQKRFNPEYVVRNDLDIQRLFAHYGVRVVLTGHYHSHDVAQAVQKDGGFVFDIETGSMMTWPVPWRELGFESNILTVTTHQVGKVRGFEGDFGEFAREFTAKGIRNIAKTIGMRLGLTEKETDIIGRQAVDSFLTHYHGDEVMPTDRPIPDREGLGFMGNIIIDNLGYVLSGMYRDSPGADRNLSIDLSTGAWTRLAE